MTSDVTGSATAFRAIEGLEARRHTLRPKSKCLSLSHRSRGNCDLLVMGPEPKPLLDDP
jgi:hypothetical protein